MRRIIGNRDYDGQAQLRLRTARKWRLEDLAHYSGLSYPSVSGYESGRLYPGERSHWAIAEALGVEPEDLLIAEKPKRGRPRAA